MGRKGGRRVPLAETEASEINLASRSRSVVSLAVKEIGSDRGMLGSI